MPQPTLSISDASLDTLEADVLVLGVRAAEDGAVIVEAPADGPLAEYLTSALAALDADGALDGVWRVPAPQDYSVSSIVLTGLGNALVTTDSLRMAAGAALRSVSKAARVAIALPALEEDHALAIIEGAVLGAHRPAKVGHSEAVGPANLIFVGFLPTWNISTADVTSAAVCLVRDLVMLPPNLLTPSTFVERILQEVSGLPLSIEVLDEQQLKDQGFGGLVAVGQGSANPPRLLILRYTPENPRRHVALVGKGITFDSGGLSLKPAGSMVGMKYDMTGAAIVSASTIAAARLNGDVQVTAFVCLAENMPSGTATRPNDVITIKGGKTVEVLNTDAEGRLVMADGLHAASQENPDLIVDIATLTGAARIALGERYAGLMGTDSAVSEIQASAQRAGELVWHMPLPEELRALLKTDVADIANAKPGNTLGGMLLAGLFLREFVGSATDGSPIPWAHLDIAGPASNSSSAWGYTPQGPTGALTRTVIDVVVGAGAKQS